MSNFFESSAFLGVAVSLLSYALGSFLKKKFKTGIFNPLLISIVITIVFLLTCNIDYETYNDGAKYLSWLLTPATVCLAIPLYQQIELLKKNHKAVLVGILSGVLTSLTTIMILAFIFKLSHKEYVTMLPKSITTAIGIGVSEELGGYVTITVAVIILTGVLGNILAEGICKLFKINHPIAKGIAIGTASHAIGTAKAMELGEIEGAMKYFNRSIRYTYGSRFNRLCKNHIRKSQDFLSWDFCIWGMEIVGATTGRPLLKHIFSFNVNLMHLIRRRLLCQLRRLHRRQRHLRPCQCRHRPCRLFLPPC